MPVDLVCRGDGDLAHEVRREEREEDRPPRAKDAVDEPERGEEGDEYRDVEAEGQEEEFMNRSISWNEGLEKYGGGKG